MWGRKTENNHMVAHYSNILRKGDTFNIINKPAISLWTEQLIFADDIFWSIS